VVPVQQRLPAPSYADGNAVYEFSPSGAKLREFGSTQAGYGALSNPEGIAVGPSGRIYVAQPDYGWVTVYNPDGSFSEFGLQASTRDAAADLAFAQGVAVEASGRVWVADTGHDRIAEFAPAGSVSEVGAVVPPPAGPLMPWWAMGLVVAAVLGLGSLAFVADRRRGLSGPGHSPRPHGPALPSLTALSRLTDPEPAPAVRAITRRGLLSGATLLTGAAVGGAVLPLNLRKALASAPDGPPRGSLRDIKNIVILRPPFPR
jgi:DNA-binding beta-propeller fold protein YncE